MSALSEDHEGNWELIYFNEIDFKKISPAVDSRPLEPSAPSEFTLPRVAFTAVQDEQLSPRSIQL
jgi:hypothetical protein